jgi:hypothetical protein
MEGWFAASAQQLHHAAPQELATCMWALGRLRLLPSKQWMRTFYSCSKRALEAAAAPGAQRQQQQGRCITVQALGDMLGGLASLGQHPPHPWVWAYWAALQRRGCVLPAGAGCGSSGYACDSGVGAAQGHMAHRHSPHSTTNWIAAAARHDSSRTDHAAVIRVVWAVAKLRLPRSRSTDAMLSRAVDQMRPVLHLLPAEQLLQLAWGVMRLRLPVTHDWCNALLQQAGVHAAALHPQQLLRLTWTLANMHHQGADAGLIAQYGQLAASRLAAFEQPEKAQLAALLTELYDTVQAAASQPDTHARGVTAQTRQQLAPVL